MRFGNSSSIAVGDPVVAIGNALGLGGSPTVTQGIISATGRTITAADETGSNEETLHGLLQTDAPIAPGNSGGPLVDAAERVIGMDTAAASSGTGGASLGFAIPANTVARVAEEIATHKDLPGLVYGRPAFLGVEVVDSSEASSAINSFGNPFGFGFGSWTGRHDAKRHRGRGRRRGRPEQPGSERGDRERRRDHRGRWAKRRPRRARSPR